MDTQFDPNMTTWYVVIPLLVLGAAALVWFVCKMRVALWKRVTLAVISVFAFFGFATGVLAAYYTWNEPFSAMFKFYAYTKLAPDQDPFTQTNGDNGKILKMLVTLEGHKEDGKVLVAQPPASMDADYVGYLFTPGTWQTVRVKDYHMTVPDDDKNGQPDTTKTSLWWALTNNPFSLTASAE